MGIYAKRVDANLFRKNPNSTAAKVFRSRVEKFVFGKKTMTWRSALSAKLAAYFEKV
jgi:hypothetical protein